MQMINQSNPAARFGGLAAVLLFHVALIYVFVTGVGKQAVQAVLQPISVQVIREQAAQPPPSPPPPPQPQVALPPPPFIPIPEVRTQAPPPPKAIVVPPSPKPPPKQEFQRSQAPVPTQVAPAPVAAPSAPAAAPSARTDASRIASAGCDVPEKPAASDRLGERGTVIISVTVGPNGAVVQSSVASSSGFKRLDDAGLAAISLCRFRPATVDGKPETSKSAVRYRFE